MHTQDYPVTTTMMAPPSGPRMAIGTSPTVAALERVITDVARTQIAVLLVGESGTGKEVFAQRIHFLSGQRDRELKKIACVSMMAETFAAELGSSAGTIFLDEVSELDAACQRILLKALGDGANSANPGSLSARLISATSKNLDDETSAGRFRPELFYRINGVRLRLPALRERKEDIPALVECLLEKHAAEMEKPAPEVSARTLQIFMEHHWPGNIRQLENVLKNVVALNNEEFAVSELLTSAAPKLLLKSNGKRDSLRAAARAASREAERELILKALDRTRWNRKRAAHDLQISYKSLLYKLKQIGLEEESEAEAV